MSIEELAIVDVLSVDPKTDRAVLTVSDHLEWTAPEEHLRLLQAKLNQYLAFVDSGEARSSLSGERERQFEFEVVFQFEPPAEAMRFLGRAAEFLAHRDITLVHRVLKDG